MTATYTGDIDSAKEFDTEAQASDAATALGIRARISRHPSYRNHDDGGWLIVDTERSRPTDPWFVKSID